MGFSIMAKMPFALELLFNGFFIVLYLFYYGGKIPPSSYEEQISWFLRTAVYIVPFAVFTTMVTNFIQIRKIGLYFRRYVFSIIIFISLLITWGDVEFAFWLSFAHFFFTIVSLYKGNRNVLSPSPLKNVNILSAVRLGPAQLVVISFVGVILLGTLLLMMPISTPGDQRASFIDALFMSTSATCVTGLVTKSIATDLSLFGQLVVLALIQIGGLSIMTLYSSMTIILGRSMGMKDRIIIQDLLGAGSLEDIFSMIVRIVKYTFFIELWGGIILTLAFTFEKHMGFGQALYYGFFHSISAFCNAGFSLFTSSFQSYATSPLISGTIAVLVTLGGLGFIVINDLKEVIIRKKSLVRLGLHSKIVLITSIFLTLSGALLIFFGEFLNALDAYTLWEKIQISLFQSVTLRTAGFNSIPLTSLHSFTLYSMTLFMFIGGSPGSTAGGVKTTTFAILIQSIMATVKGRGKVSMLDRSVSGPIVVRAIALTFISILLMGFFVFILMRIEPEQSFLAIFFEVVSASGTVGLTLGITPFLSVLGKLAVSLLMLSGRIGPLTLILAIGQQRTSRGKVDYPSGQIMIG